MKNYGEFMETHCEDDQNTMNGTKVIPKSGSYGWTMDSTRETCNSH